MLMSYSRDSIMERSKPIEIPLDGNWRKEDATLGEVMEATSLQAVCGFPHVLGENMTKYVL